MLSKSVAITNATSIVFTRIMLEGPEQDARERHVSGDSSSSSSTGSRMGAMDVRRTSGDRAPNARLEPVSCPKAVQAR